MTISDLSSPQARGGADQAPRPAAPAWSTHSGEPFADHILRGVGIITAVLPAVILLFIAAVMLVSAWPAFQFSSLGLFGSYTFTFGSLYGSSFVTQHGVQAPSGAEYGILGLVFGTVVSSLIALLVAVPVSVGAILLLGELPRRIQMLVGVVLELLASIPSVAFGLWGILFLGPVLSAYLFPFLAATLGTFLPFFAGPVGYGQGLLTASLVLAIMIIPIVAATTRELVRTVPVLWKEGAVALGLTRYEIIRAVIFPYVRGGILAAALLGWGRALGETMAVLMISGNALNQIPQHVYSPASTMASTIAAMLDSALTDATSMATHALAAVGVILLLITLITNFLGRLVVRRFSGGALPVGRGV